MTAKEFLSRGYRLQERIVSERMEMAQLRQMAQSVQGPQLSAVPAHGTGKSDASFVNPVLRAMELERKIQTDVAAQIAVLEEIEAVIRRVESPDEQLLLRLRYINFMKWREIEKTMHVAHRTVFRIHAEALRCVDAILAE